MNKTSLLFFRCVWTGVVLVGLAGCASPKSAMTTDPELSRVAGIARISFEQGSLEQSARLYARALRMARTMDDAREIGSNAYNLAACLAELGRYSEALAFLREARAEFERADRPLAEVTMLEAKVALLDGRLDDALVLGDQVVPAARKGDRAVFGVQVLLLRAEIAAARNSSLEAQAELDRAKAELRKLKEPLLEAQAAGVEGRVLLVSRLPARAAEAFDRQAGLLRGVARFREMALALGRAGDAYGQDGAFDPATDRFYRAARSLYAQGDDLEALKMIQSAISVGEKSGDENVVHLIAALFEEIKQRVEGVKKIASEASKDIPEN